MASFSEFDRGIILAIANEDSHPRLLGDIFANILSYSNEYAFWVTNDPITCHVLALSQTKSVTLQYNIADFISIISYLKDNGYIVLVDSPSVWGRLYYKGVYEINTLDECTPVESKSRTTNISDNKYRVDLSIGNILTFVQTVKDGYPISVGDVEITNGEIVLTSKVCGYNLISILKEMLGCFAYPTSKLKNLVKNKFQTEEELYNNKVLAKADKQIQKAQAAVVIAIITLLINAIGVIAQSFDLTIIPLVNLKFILLDFFK